MITYEPPEQQEVNVGDHIEGIGTVADPDDLKVTELPQRPAVEGNRGGRPMTVTETLRAMLDDRGVKWHNRDSESGHDDCLVFKTWWKGNLLYEESYPNGDSYTLLEARAVEHITPEQAVEATLGRGTCKPTTYDDGYSADRVDPGDYYEFWEPACACGNCGELIPMRKFCPNCGCRLEVDE